MWTPEEYYLEQLTRFAEVITEPAMAREAEKTGIERMMELMLQMHAGDRNLGRKGEKGRKDRQW